MKLIFGFGLVLLIASGTGCSHGASQTESGDSSSRSDVADSIHAQISQIRECHQKATDRAGFVITGNLRLHFVIDRSGVVKSVSRESSDLSNSDMEACISDIVHKIKFQKPRNGGELNVSYPFKFKKTPSGLIQEIFGD